jgi:aspartyl-tRNA(Asn)/glutamyl-tRNA(Gln) amidotransferase subunit A
VPLRSARSTVDICFEQIDHYDGALRAWVTLDREGARQGADALDESARTGAPRGPLHGMPVALKDIFDAAGMPTTSGAAPFAHRLPERDAPAVNRLRSAGAVILGKTVTTEFAFADPSITRNPWNLEHTPGGSSSGSAAAVAAGMAQAALGSQTIGSTIRPAAYCGIVGFKGTYGRITTEGVTPLSWSLDHIGIFARSVDDTARVFSAITDEAGAAATPGPDAPSHPPRFAVPRGWVRSLSAPEVQTHLDEVVAVLQGAGAYVEDIELPPSASRIEADGRLVLRVEAAAYHSRWFSQHASEYGRKIKELVESGQAVTATAYVHANETRSAFRREMSAVFQDHDALLLPAAPSTAPALSEETTGDPVFCAPWTFAGFPAIALPSGLSSLGLPLSTQLVGPVAADARLLAIARWCETHFRFAAAPPL